MSSLPNQPDDLANEVLPDALVRDLRSAYARDVRVPHAVDAAILDQARAGFARRRRFRLAVRGVLVAAGGAAAAAVVLLAVRFSGPDTGASSQPPLARQPQALPPAPAAAVARVEDVDRSGRVDILDAFVVARLVDLQDQLDQPTYDVNRDGKVDLSDVDRIATAAVDTSAPRPDDRRLQ